MIFDPYKYCYNNDSDEQQDTLANDDISQNQDKTAYVLEIQNVTTNNIKEIHKYIIKLVKEIHPMREYTITKNTTIQYDRYFECFLGIIKFTPQERESLNVYLKHYVENIPCATYTLIKYYNNKIKETVYYLRHLSKTKITILQQYLINNNIKYKKAIIEQKELDDKETTIQSNQYLQPQYLSNILMAQNELIQIKQQLSKTQQSLQSSQRTILLEIETTKGRHCDIQSLIYTMLQAQIEKYQTKINNNMVNNRNIDYQHYNDI